MEYYSIKREVIKDTDKFRPSALCFTKYGSYTAAPRGTTAYLEYWNEERRRCLEGYEVDGYYISGYFYFYLNFCQIIKNFKNPKTGQLQRKKGFPDYYDYDKAYFDYIDACEKNNSHAAVIKARRKGFSFKGAAMLCRNFYLIPGSKSYAVASDITFLTKDGLLTKAWEFMSFIDENTAWAKKRQKVDTKIHKRASLVIDIGGVKTEVGYMSEIIGISLKNDIDKIRGIAGKLILFEEAGKFPHLIDAWQVARPSVESVEGESYGLMCIYGTGGTDQSDYIGLQSIFYEPETYKCLPVENTWDEGATRYCGFFVPHYYNMGERFMDEFGNSLIDEALKFALAEREKIVKNATNRVAVDRYITERPFTPAEATLQISGNIFPKAELIRHLAFIRTNKSVKEFKQVGELVFGEGSVLKWVPSKVPNDLVSYRVSKGIDLAGSIVIWEHPEENPPYGLYIAGLDSYDHDKSSTDSLGSVFIYKRFQSFEKYYETVVAEYTGRPETAEEFYENVRKLLLYYNATCLYENANKGVFQYFVKKHCEYLLADQPSIVKDIVKDSSVHRGKGIHAVKAIQDWAESRVKEWLLEERGEGQLGLHTILSEPLLEELVAYNDTSNFDRVIALSMVMIYREELHNIHVKGKKKQTYSNRLFPDGVFVENKYHFL